MDNSNSPELSYEIRPKMYEDIEIDTEKNEAKDMVIGWDTRSYRHKVTAHSEDGGRKYVTEVHNGCKVTISTREIIKRNRKVQLLDMWPKDSSDIGWILYLVAVHVGPKEFQEKKFIGSETEIDQEHVLIILEPDGCGTPDDSERSR